ncbi:hypothetical protein LOK74_17030 [Brevibacillus humidisoli]|uniref:hypothetical protein n=1 Tax=Brevibacillus humidisoli TaxID=2895522 RepID=UPI001E48C79C|nr:hypothetical protein [Brevibacillus humidisoli]UFJ39743.1 hypothetical protein LOK74_17030 [Brevibacillus humidisoli]
MRKRMLSLALLLFLAAGCSETAAPSDVSTSPSPAPDQNEPNRVPLSFVPVPPEDISVTDAPVELVKVKSFGLQRISGKKNVFVHLYVDPQFQNKPEQGEVIAYLQDGADLYNLGIVTDYGIAQASVQAADLNGDGRSEIELSGHLGSHYEEIRVFGFDSEQGKWLRYLQTGSPLKKDLDGDGRAELLAVSQGTIPSYLWIFRWENGQFSQADVATAVDGEYARLIDGEPQPLIDTGSADDSRLFRYQQGDLVEWEKQSK